MGVFSKAGLIGIAALSLLGSVVADFAYGQAYPTKTVRVILGFPAGGPTDIVARAMGQGSGMPPQPGLSPLHGGVPGASGPLGRCALAYMDDCLVHGALADVGAAPTRRCRSPGDLP